MARRKVTMLEAFQRSARESAERAAAERRRVIADREKEIRRAEAAKVAHDFGHRLSQRANDSMGSLLAGIRGGAADLVDDPAEEAEAGSRDAAAATDINRVPPLEAGLAVQGEPASDPDLPSPSHPGKRSGPALPAFDRATHEDLAEVASGPRAGSLPAEVVVDDLDEAAAQEEGPEEDPFKDATQEEVEHAIASLEEDVFELPMSARTFGLLSVAVLAVVFMLGYTVGGREVAGDARGPDPGYGRAGLDRLGESRPSGGAFQSPSEAGRTESGSVANAALAYGSRAGNSGFGSNPAFSNDAGEGAGSGRQGQMAGPAQSPPVVAMTPEDEAFRSPAMKFSILAITYSRTEAHAQMAMETYDYLYAEGFPVIHPIEKGSRIYVLVGAARTKSELAELRTEIQELRSARSGAQEFRSAMLVNTDSYR